MASVDQQGTPGLAYRLCAAAMLIMTHSLAEYQTLAPLKSWQV